MRFTLIFVFAACGPESPFTPCQRPLEGWCFHDENEEGPVLPNEDATCRDESFTPGPGAFRCDDRWDVMASSGGFTGSQRYYDAETGELVGVTYWTDTNHYCGGFDFSYGRVIECNVVDCMWTQEEADAAGLPLCEG